MFLFRDFNLGLDKELRFALKNIYGIGFYKSNYLLSRLVSLTLSLLEI